MNIETIYHECIELKKSMKKSFIINDGITDSINTCLINFKSKKYKNMLDNLIRPQFITEDNEFQEIIQYLIITDDYS